MPGSVCRPTMTGMTSTPQAFAAATKTMPLPDGDEERVVGFGVMGLPFSGGHYLACPTTAGPTKVWRLP